MANKWQTLMGKLCSVVIAIPGGKGLFSVLQNVLKNNCGQGKRVQLTQPVHSVLQDFRWLAGDLTRRPTRTPELVPNTRPDTLGAQDSAAAGIGGAHFVHQHDGSILPLLSRSPFPRLIQERLVTYENPGGGGVINNSEF
jgi:hypothetical protein